MIDTPQLFDDPVTAPCIGDHAGCAQHEAVWEQREPTCWYVRRIGKFAHQSFVEQHDQRIRERGLVTKSPTLTVPRGPHV